MKRTLERRQRKPMLKAIKESHKEWINKVENSRLERYKYHSQYAG